jgi:hypothetical protein
VASVDPTDARKAPPWNTSAIPAFGRAIIRALSK